MTLKEELTRYIHETFHTIWDIKDWDRVPTEDDAIGLGNKGIKIDATVLYADLTDSTGLVKNYTQAFGAEVYKSYVYAAAKVIRYFGGSVTAYDGDRVMGVFIGPQMRNEAVSAAFKVSAVVDQIIQPELNSQYGNNKYTVRQKIGIDHSSILVANTGIRGNNDYVWVGTAANNAAKMAALKRGYNTYVTQDVYSVLNENNKKSNSGWGLWTDLGSNDLGFKIYGSNAYSVAV